MSRILCSLALLLLGAAPAFAINPLNCGLGAPTDWIDTSPRPLWVTEKALAAIQAMQPLNTAGTTTGTQKNITIAIPGNSNSVVYAAGTVDWLVAHGGLRPELYAPVSATLGTWLLEAGAAGQGVTEWTSMAPGGPLMTARQRAINFKRGMPQAIIFWAVKVKPDQFGLMTRDDVTAALNAFKAVWPTATLAIMIEQAGAPYLDPRDQQPNSNQNPLLRHSSVVHEANLFHKMQGDFTEDENHVKHQIGVPDGMTLIHVGMVANGMTPNADGWQLPCSYNKSDGIHPTSAELFGDAVDSQAPFGAYIGAKLEADPVTHTLLYGTPVEPPPPPPPPTEVPLPDTTLELPACVLHATVNGAPQTTPAPATWCAP